jgi:hypothetical protein
MHSRILTILTLGMGIVGSASAHPGGLNSQGCHNDRKNGGYHCHQPASVKGLRQGNSQDSLNPQSLIGGSYTNCAAARAAGAAPVRRGQPGYGPHLDRDNDGVGCE